MQHARFLTSRFTLGLTVIVALVALTFTCPLGAEPINDGAGDVAHPQSSFESKRWGLSFDGLLMSGRVSPCFLPVGSDYGGGMIPIETPFGFGLCLDYNMSPALRLYVDGNFYSYRRQVGVEGEYSESFWVYEMTDYESHYIGPFEEDAFFYMQTTGIRVGAKYGFLKNNMRPWVGAGIGIYAWKADYCTADRSASWGSASGTVVGPTFQIGIDFILGRDSKSPMVFSLFGDFASPVVNPVIDNLFQDGWTWDNSGGSHVMGPYRFGASIGFLH